MTYGERWLDQLQGHRMMLDFKQLMKTVKCDDGRFVPVAREILLWKLKNEMFAMEDGTPSGAAIYAALLQLLVQCLFERPDAKIMSDVHVRVTQDLHLFEQVVRDTRNLLPASYTFSELAIISEARVCISASLLRLDCYRPA